MSIFDDEDYDDQSAFNLWLNSSPTSHQKTQSIPVPRCPKYKAPAPPIDNDNDDGYDSPQPIKPRIRYDSDGNEIEDDGYRNPIGGGEGRPIQYEEKATKKSTIKFTPKQHEKFLAIGGSGWIKGLLEKIPMPVKKSDL